MEKSGQEWVSAAIDGEVDKSAIDDLSVDITSHKKWQRYHMIGDAMRNELPKTFDLDLSGRIAEALENEPVHNGSNIDTLNSAATEIKSINKRDRLAGTKKTANKASKKSAKVVPLFKQFGQYAIAASVALVAVVGVQNYTQNQNGDLSPLPVLDTRPLVGSVSPVSLQTGPVQQFQQASNDSSEQINEQRRRLNSYIQDHMLQQRLNSGNVMDNHSVHQAN